MNPITASLRVSTVMLACCALLTACGGDSADSTTAQTITFANPGAQSLNATPVTLSATASSGLAVAFASTSASVCTVSGTSLTLLTAGECSVTASQAGGSGFTEATSITETFTVSQASQSITFANPGAQLLGTTPALTATASSGLVVSFASTTPTVCTVTGSTLSPVSAGQCSITASQTGNAAYAAATPITNTFTVSAAALTFLSGYQSGSTIEGGGYGGYAGGSLDGYFCDSSSSTWCGSSGSYSPAVSAASSSFSYHYNTPSKSDAEYMGIYVQAPGVTSISSSSDTGGVQVTDQTALTFSLAENSEWFSTANTSINVTLILGHLFGADASACNINLGSTLTPTAAASTSYSVALSALAVTKNCGSSMSATAALAAYPVSQIVFQTVTGNAGSSAAANADGTAYPTAITLTGAIAFQ